MAGITRRSFAASAAVGSSVWGQPASGPRPNILWLTCEDTGPHLHACGDEYSVTPNLDRLCAQGYLYRNAWSNAPVCAPARTTIISGMYPPSTGSEHMRSLTRLPAGMKMFPQYLREAGYYTSNNAKEDYNLEKPGQVWDESSARAHFRKRAPGQPFFSVFNFLITHESQIRRRPHTLVHDPAKVRVPAYMPDTPEVRHDWAQYYDNITTMDGMAGKVMEELQADGLAEDTVIFFYGDHGPGMPRNKRWPYNSGLNVSIVASIPRKFRHLAPPEYQEGKATDRLVGFVDLAPTVLSLAGVPLPGHFQGHAFLGAQRSAEQPYAYGFRGRMDERYDMVRTVRDKRYVYIRNYMPHKIYGQHINYMFEMPTTQVWKRLYDEGKLNDVQKRFWEPKPAEELYDLQADRDEVNNLAASPKHAGIVKRLRGAQRELASRIRDVGFLPEHEIHERGSQSSPYESGHDPKRYPVEEVIGAAELASTLGPGTAEKLIANLTHKDSGVRYWAAMGFVIRGAVATKAYATQLTKALADPAPNVRIAAAEALGRWGSDEESRQALDILLRLASPEANGVYLAMASLNAIGAMGHRAAGAKETIRGLPLKAPGAPQTTQEYVPRLVEKLLEDLA